MRDLFVSTLTTLVSATSTGLNAGLNQSVAGGIINWFDRKSQRRENSQLAGGAAALEAQFQAQQAQLAFEQAQALQQAQLLQQAQAQQQSQALQQSGSPQEFPPQVFFDPRTGAPTSVDPNLLRTSDNNSGLVAGLAFEVHVFDASGATAPVDPATHMFRTGDRFMVFFRPALPGRMDVFNINPLGVESQIDSTQMAAGQLAQLGPYEFTANTGNDSLRLVLTPCSSPELLIATRDIVNVSGPLPASTQIAACGSTQPLVRGLGQAVQTRDIRRVAVEGTTGFALDPVTAQESASGQLAPREITIVFRHL
jgi:hypothetical protein